jgi:hypothetical protein
MLVFLYVLAASLIVGVITTFTNRTIGWGIAGFVITAVSVAIAILIGRMITGA